MAKMKESTEKSDPINAFEPFMEKELNIYTDTKPKSTKFKFLNRAINGNITININNSSPKAVI